MNKYKKMFDWYNDMIWGSTKDPSFVEARATLAELVERATDKTVIWESECEDGFDMHTAYIECPMCGYSFTDDELYRKVNYCPECGQSLRWEEYEEMEL